MAGFRAILPIQTLDVWNIYNHLCNSLPHKWPCHVSKYSYDTWSHGGPIINHKINLAFGDGLLLGLPHYGLFKNCGLFRSIFLHLPGCGVHSDLGRFLADESAGGGDQSDKRQSEACPWYCKGVTLFGYICY